MVNKEKHILGGAIGVLLEEYEKSLQELICVIKQISQEQLLQIVDADTNNVDFKSIQTILSHIIWSGLYYNIEIRNSLGETLDPPASILFSNVQDYQESLINMFELTKQTFQVYNDVDVNSARDFRWKLIGNIDLLLEHAIVHILRHRRQIEKFIDKIELENLCPKL